MIPPSLPTYSPGAKYEGLGGALYIEQRDLWAPHHVALQGIISRENVSSLVQAIRYVRQGIDDLPLLLVRQPLLHETLPQRNIPLHTRVLHKADGRVPTHHLVIVAKHHIETGRKVVGFEVFLRPNVRVGNVVGSLQVSVSVLGIKLSPLTGSEVRETLGAPLRWPQDRRRAQNETQNLGDQHSHDAQPGVHVCASGKGYVPKFI